MSKIISFIIGMALVLLLIEIEGQKPIPVETEIEHWKIDDHYTHTITFRADSVKPLVKALQEYHPYWYETKVEIRFATETLEGFDSKYDEIKTTLRNEFPNW